MQMLRFCFVTLARPSLATLALPPLVIAMGGAVSSAAAQTDTYPRMAAISQYQMEETAEIQLARRVPAEAELTKDKKGELLVRGDWGMEPRGHVLHPGGSRRRLRPVGCRRG
jgi:hypothetical protein